MAVRPPPASLAPPSNVTVAIPLAAIPAVTVVQAPPAIVTKRNPGHVGMSWPELSRVLRRMAADPRFRDKVIRYGKSFRGAPPDAIVAFLRAAPPDTMPNGQQDDSAIDLELLDDMGYEQAQGRARGRR